MIIKILHIIETWLTRIRPQIQSRSHFAWQSEFLFIQEKSRLTLAPIGQDKLPRCDFSSASYDTVRSPYDTSARNFCEGWSFRMGLITENGDLISANSLGAATDLRICRRGYDPRGIGQPLRPSEDCTITAERGANPRVRKICYWLEMVRRDGRDPVNEMREGLGGEMPHFGDNEGISARIRIDLLLRLVLCNPA